MVLLEENLYGWVVALSAHFQAFCRDLATETGQLLAAEIPHPDIQVAVQALFTAGGKLRTGNPNLTNLKAEFKLFQIDLKFTEEDPANESRISDLDHLNTWRNLAAHQGKPDASHGSLTVVRVARWRTSCEGLVGALHQIVYNRLSQVLGRPPW